MNRVQKIKKLKAGFKFYKNSFGLHPPYLILCDSNFLYAAVDSRISLEDTFKTVLKGQIYLKISNCALNELKQMEGKKFAETKKFAYNNCQRFNCSHPPKKPNQCIYQALQQGFGGCVCTQDQDLRRKIHRDFPKIPVFFIANQSMVICPPPKSLKEKVKMELMAKYAPQALKKENAKPQEEIELKEQDKDKTEVEEEEEEEEFREDTDIKITENNSEKKNSEIDVLQNVLDDKQEEEINGNESLQEDQNKDSKRKRKRSIDIEQNIDNQNISEENQSVDENSQNNGDTEPRKRRKKHHRHTNPDDDD